MELDNCEQGGDYSFIIEEGNLEFLVGCMNFGDGDDMMRLKRGVKDIMMYAELDILEVDI